MQEFIWPIRVYYEDTDAGGVVYHSTYLNYMERARSEWLRSLGFEQDMIRQRYGVLLAVHSVRLDFKRPAKFNDQLQVTAAVNRYGKASMDFSQVVRRSDHDRTLLCSGEIKIACVDALTFRPKSIPDSIYSRLHDVD